MAAVAVNYYGWVLLAPRRFSAGGFSANWKANPKCHLQHEFKLVKFSPPSSLPLPISFRSVGMFQGNVTVIFQSQVVNLILDFKDDFKSSLRKVFFLFTLSLLVISICVAPLPLPHHSIVFLATQIIIPAFGYTILLSTRSLPEHAVKNPWFETKQIIFLTFRP